MQGGFVFVVGPSGAGKDTLIRLAREDLADDGRFLFPRRLVTRAVSPWEDHDTISPAEFRDGHEAGRFALSWEAHGLGYAIPGEAREAADHGCLVVVNVSRKQIARARQILPQVSVVEISAPLAVLATRLAARARDEDGDLSARLERSRMVGPVDADHTIVNDGSARDAAAELVAYLRKRAG